MLVTTPIKNFQGCPCTLAYIKSYFHFWHIHPLFYYFTSTQTSNSSYAFSLISSYSSPNCFLIKIMLYFFRSPCLYICLVFCTMLLVLPALLPHPPGLTQFYYKSQLTCHFISDHPDPSQTELVSCFLVNSTHLSSIII